MECILRFVTDGSSTELLAELDSVIQQSKAAGVSFEQNIAFGPIFVETCLGLLIEEGVPREDRLAAYASLVRISHIRQTELMRCYHAEESERGTVPSGPAESPGNGALISGRKRDHLCGLVGSSGLMQATYHRVEDCSRSRETVFVTGESGTGKELVARAIHLCSGDPPERWVPVNCASMQPQMMVALLSGHRRGAFTGAMESNIGLVRSAEGGTLFLDEITEMTSESQAALLRVIQEHCVLPIGESREIPVKVRIIASTNEPPERSVAGGKLRRDLYYRLQRLVVKLPPLRDHVEDVPRLIQNFAERWRTANRTELRPRFSSGATTRMMQHTWPGNVRELENTVFALCSFVGDEVIAARHVEAQLAITRDLPEEHPGVPVALREAERVTIVRALNVAAGNKSLAARLLGLSRKQLYVKLKVYSLETR